MTFYRRPSGTVCFRRISRREKTTVKPVRVHAYLLSLVFLIRAHVIILYFHLVNNISMQSMYTQFFLYKNVVFPAQAEHSYFSADFRLKIFLYYSEIIAYDISVLEYIGVSSIVSAGFCALLASFAVQRME